MKDEHNSLDLTVDIDIEPSLDGVEVKATAKLGQRPISTKKVFVKYSQTQPRDNHGRFAGGSGGLARQLAERLGPHTAVQLLDLANRLDKPDGWFTYQPVNEDAPQGYIVSPFADRSFGKKAVDITANDILEYVNKNADLLTQKGTYLGGWHNPKTGEGFLDVVVVAKTHEEAVDVCKAKDQIAYFDAYKGETIFVNENATSGGAAGSSKNYQGDHLVSTLTTLNTSTMSVADLEKFYQNLTGKTFTPEERSKLEETLAANRSKTAELPDEKSLDLKYDPHQPRDNHGRFAGSSGSGSGATSGSGGDSGGEDDIPLSIHSYSTIAQSRITDERATAPPPGHAYKPKVNEDYNKDGVTDAARVGVPALSTPPPVPRLPHLNRKERQVESEFISTFEKDPDGVASKFTELVKKAAAEGKDPKVPTFGTDDAKELHDAWNGKGLPLEDRSKNRATLNVALHQTANAIAKKAFIQHLDTLKPGDRVLVTVGGCGAGKGYALGQVPEALALKANSKAVWDSAGDQNATENPWVQRELEKRGLVGDYLYVHADPETQWGHPKMGVVQRANNPKDGRMVDAHVFADSYAIGAKNHQAFFDRNKKNPNATFMFLVNGEKPRKLDGIPSEALEIDASHLRQVCHKVIQDREGIPPHIKRGATLGNRIWPEEVVVASRKEVMELQTKMTDILSPSNTPSEHRDPSKSRMEQWWEEDAARHNRLGELASEMKITVKTSYKPVVLNEDGSDPEEL